MGIISIIVTAISLFFAVIIHEIAHGVMALWCGDTTARNAGRLTLNPIRHIDPIGTIVLPAILALTGSSVMMGWAKPVPINIYRTRNPRKALWLIAAAGPLSNLIQALIAILLAFIIALVAKIFAHVGFFNFGTHIYADGPHMLVNLILFINGRVLMTYFIVNIMLMAFNLIPIPPLDGSRIVTAMLSPKAAYKYLMLERFGFIIVFVLLYLNVLDIFLNPILSGSIFMFQRIVFGV